MQKHRPQRSEAPRSSGHSFVGNARTLPSAPALIVRRPAPGKARQQFSCRDIRRGRPSFLILSVSSCEQWLKLRISRLGGAPKHRSFLYKERVGTFEKRAAKRANIGAARQTQNQCTRQPRGREGGEDLSVMYMSIEYPTNPRFALR